MSARAAARLRIAGLLVVGILIQTTLVPDLRVSGVAPDLMLLLAVCGGLAGGAVPGAITGFAAGLLADVWLTDTPFGLSALVWCLMAFAVGALRANVLREGRVVIPMLAVAGTAAGVLLFVGLGELVGQDQLFSAGRSWLVRVVVVESIWAAVLSWPVSRLFGWAARGSDGALELGSGWPERAARR